MIYPVPAHDTDAYICPRLVNVFVWIARRRLALYDKCMLAAAVITQLENTDLI